MEKNQKYRNLTPSYFSFIKYFFLKYDISSDIFYHGVRCKWGIKDVDALTSKKLEQLFIRLETAPDRFFDYSLNWGTTPRNNDVSWVKIHSTFQKEYLEWRKSHYK